MKRDCVIRHADISGDRLEIDIRADKKIGPSIVGFFPGLGSLSAYRDLDDSLLRCGLHEVADVYRRAAAAIGHEAEPERLLMTPENLPADRIDRHGFLGASFLTHNLAIAAYLKASIRRNGAAAQFQAFTGESFGIIAAAVEGGALSIGSGVKIAQFFTPMMLLAAEGRSGGSTFSEKVFSYLAEAIGDRRLVTENFRVVGLKGHAEDLSQAVENLGAFYSRSDVEIHKIYSPRHINLYVRGSVKSSFDLFMRNFPAVENIELKAPTTFLAHSERMWPARSALLRFFDDAGIVFEAPHTPIVSNHSTGLLLQSGDSVREAVLAIIDETMNSRATVENISLLQPDAIIEIGAGGKSITLMEDNNADTPFVSCSGISREAAAILSVIALHNEIHESIRRLRETGAQLEYYQYDLLRNTFGLAVRHPFCARYFHRVFMRYLTDEINAPADHKSRTVRGFLEVFQHSFRFQSQIMLTAGELVMQAQIKRVIASDGSVNGNVVADLRVFDAVNKAVERRVYPRHFLESVIFQFGYPDTISVNRLARNTRTLLHYQPLAVDIYRNLVKKLGNYGDPLAMLERSQPIAAEHLAAHYMVYQYTLFQVLSRNRPSIIAQNDFHFQCRDTMGWLIALAASEALPLRAALKLYLAFLRLGPGSSDFGEALQSHMQSLGAPQVALFSLNGTPVHTRQELENETYSVFLGQAQEPAFHIPRMNSSCCVISFGSSVFPEQSFAGLNDNQIIVLDDPTDIWQRFRNADLDELEDACLSAATEENQIIVQYARGRSIPSTVVRSYLNLGERIVGFGKGGSESMTMFFVREA